MRRQTLCALAILLSLAMTGVVRAQSEQQAPPPSQPQNPPKAERRPGDATPQGHGRYLWWKDEKFRAEVGFTIEQANKIDEIVTSNRQISVPLWKEIQQLDKEIDKMIVESADIMVFKQQVEKVEARRAEFNKLRTVTLYRIQRVLTPEQRTKFRAAVERREAERKKQDGDRRK
jgi:Spy/CpxP family protein refolding chaperone